MKEVKILNEILQQYEKSILEAVTGDIDAIESLEDNKKAVNALNVAIETLQEKSSRDKMACADCKYRATCPQEMNVDGTQREALMDVDFCSRFEKMED